jgi:uncharacterized protein
MRIVVKLFEYSLAIFERLILRHPKTLIFLTCIACGFSLYYTIENIKINTDTTNILSSDLPFQQDRQRLLKAFPQDDQAILVVIEAKTPEQTNKALSYLGEQFRQEQRQIESVYIPGEGPYFDKNGLLYLDSADVKKLADQLTEAQPFIGTLSGDNSLKGLFSIIELALSAENRDLPIDLTIMLDKVRMAIQANMEGKDYSLSWQQMMMGAGQSVLATQRFILLKPKLDFSTLMPAELSLKAVRAIVANAKQLFPDTGIRLTGEIVLEHDELKSVQYSTELASVISIMLVFISLMVGFRSLKLTVVTLIVMLMGSILTAGFATIAIGSLNLISISFAVLYIGIADDYAVQLCLRYRELLQEKVSKKQAVIGALHSVGPSTALCALTASIGFFAFVPTAYTGVSELGIIAGAGIFIAFTISMLVLPALLSLLSLDLTRSARPRLALPEWVYRFPTQHRSLIQVISVILTITGMALLTQVRFDFNPLNLRDPDSEAVVTFRELLKTKETSPMTLSALASNRSDALATAQKLKDLKTVENAITIFDFVPEGQEEKIAILEDLSLVMGLRLTEFPALHEDTLENHTLALKNLKKTIAKQLEGMPEQNPLWVSLRNLDTVLAQFLSKLEADSTTEKKLRLEKLQTSLLSTLQDTMNSLFRGLQANKVTLEALPKDLTERWLSKEGLYRVVIIPSKNLNELDNLKEFIGEVRKIAPNATDLPVIYLETGNAVVKAFQQALMSALLAITVVLLIVQRSLKETLRTLLPLLMAAILTGASTVLMNNPFNFANIIIIPLLFGLGADGGIFISRRIRSMSSQKDSVLRTSTARGVVFSNLTTICSLVSMAFTPHLGLASMGQLLTIGLVLTMICTLLVLPAFSSTGRNERSGGIN